MYCKHQLHVPTVYCTYQVHFPVLHMHIRYTCLYCTHKIHVPVCNIPFTIEHVFVLHTPGTHISYLQCTHQVHVSVLHTTGIHIYTAHNRYTCLYRTQQVHMSVLHKTDTRVCTAHTMYSCTRVCLEHTMYNWTCILGWVNFSEFEITECGSCKMSKKTKTDHFLFFYKNFILWKPLIIFPPPYIVKKNKLHFRKCLKTV